MRIQHNIDNVFQMIEGHRKCLDNNTGITVTESQNRLVNNDGLIASGWLGNKISNDWALPESQAVLILGLIEAYRGSSDTFYLDRAKKAWDAYNNHLLGNYAVESKLDRLSHYPLSTDGVPSHGGFKDVVVTFKNGRGKIPAGSPTWGEYLDKAYQAYRGVLGRNTVDSDVYGGTDDNPDWTTSGLSWWVEWYIAWDGNRYWANGRIAEGGHTSEEFGTVQLQDKGVTGDHKLTYCVRLPEEHGGSKITAGSPVVLNPVNVIADNKAADLDGEEMWCDACHQLYEITGEEKYYTAFKNSYSRLMKFSDINAYDKIFRKTTLIKAPFTDGTCLVIGSKPVMNRDRDGYLNITMEPRSPCEIVQKGTTYLVDRSSEVVMNFGGQGILFQPYFIINDGNSKKQYRIGVPFGDAAVVEVSAKITNFVEVVGKDGNPYLLPKEENVNVKDGATASLGYDTNIYNHSDNYTRFNVSSGSVTFNFEREISLSSVTYRSDDEMVRLKFLDKERWMWYADLYATNGQWNTETLTLGDFKLSPSQPHHTEDEIKPFFANTKGISSIDFSLSDQQVGNGVFDLYCVNTLPQFYSSSKDAYLIWFSVGMSCKDKATAKIGDCYIKNYKQGAYRHTPGVLPAGCVIDPDNYLLEERPNWPYPGLQYPVVYCMGGEVADRRHLSNTIGFLRDAQVWYNNTFHAEGPVASRYVWQKGNEGLSGWWEMVDNSKLQSRSFVAACRAIYELKKHKEPVDERLFIFCKKWVEFLNTFRSSNSGNLPTDFNTSGGYSYQDRGDRMWVVGEWLAGCCWLGLCGYASLIPQIDAVAEACMNLLQKHYFVNSTNILNGCWAVSDPVGYHSGEILRGLGLYAQYRGLYL